jgi:hypothetical protein
MRNSDDPLVPTTDKPPLPTSHLCRQAVSADKPPLPTSRLCRQSASADNLRLTAFGTLVHYIWGITQGLIWCPLPFEFLWSGQCIAHQLEAFCLVVMDLEIMCDYHRLSNCGQRLDLQPFFCVQRFIHKRTVNTTYAPMWIIGRTIGYVIWGLLSLHRIPFPNWCCGSLPPSSFRSRKATWLIARSLAGFTNRYDIISTLKAVCKYCRHI